MHEQALTLDQGTWDALVEHAWSDHPFEVCGLLGIKPDGTFAHYRIDNDARSMTYYAMNARQLLRAMREIEDHGWGLAIYHSHTHTEAYPSKTDLELAAYPEATYLIISLQDRDEPTIRGYSIVDGSTEEKPVTIA